MCFVMPATLFFKLRKHTTANCAINVLKTNISDAKIPGAALDCDLSRARDVAAGVTVGVHLAKETVILRELAPHAEDELFRGPLRLSLRHVLIAQK